MALGDEDLQKSNRSSSSKSGSSSRQSGKCPQLLIRETDEGFEGKLYPNTPSMTTDELMEGDKKVIWDQGFFKRLKQAASEEYNEDLKKVVKEDPSRALKIINQLAQLIKENSSGVNKQAQKYRDCAICDKSLYMIGDNYVRVGDSKEKVVCNSHTAKDLANNDLI